MNGYMAKRLLLVVPTLLGVTLLVFFSIHALPGGPAAVACGTNCSPSQYAEIEKALGLDRPVPIQYVEWIGGVLRGDLGTSLSSGLPIAQQLRDKVPVTFELGIIGIFTGVLIAIPVGIIAAARQDSIIDYVCRTLSVGLLAIPSFWLAIFLIALGSRFSFWTPPLNYVAMTQDPVANIRIMWVPGLLLGFGLSGGLMRLTRTQMLEVLRQDYIRTAWAKGLSERVIIMRHAVRNGLLPIITIIGAQVPIVVGGSVILETIFSLPGMGRYLLDAIGRSDLPVVQSVNLLVASVIILDNVLVDYLYTVVDPRVSF